MINIITADDHELIRFGLRKAIEKTNDIQVVTEARDGHQLLSQLKKVNCDVILLDISMPGMDIFDLIREIHLITAKKPILILTMHPESQYAIRLMAAGVSGYLKKSCSYSSIIDAIRQVHSGKKYITSEVAEKLTEHVYSNSQSPAHEKLTTREYQVMQRIAAGKTVSEIAVELNISVKTVSTHRSNILKKMDLQNNAQIMHYAVENALI